MEDTATAAEGALLRIGPGPRLDRVASLAEALVRATPGAPALARWFDVAELLLCGPRERVVIDADHFPMEDIGILRRFLALRPTSMVEAIGSDRTRPEGRALLALPRSRWHPWPLDLIVLEALLRSPALPIEAAPIAAHAPAGTSLPGSSSEPRGFELRAPLGDLAAQVRRTHEVLLTLRSAGNLDPVASETLGGEVLRLERALRSLSLGAERSPRLPEELDLDALVEEELAVLALQSRRASRVRYQGGEVLPVRADRATLVHTLGVLLDLVRTLASGGEPVEVRSLRSPADRNPSSPPRAIVRLRAPAGVLADLSPAQIFEPAGLGERVPGIGPSELCVLARLCAVRGLTLEARSIAGAPAQLEFDLSAPISERTSTLLAGASGPL